MLFHFIKQIRKESGFTQEYLAEQINVSRPTLSQIERGERELTLPEAEKLASVFNISLGNFLAQKKNETRVILENEKKSASKTARLSIRVRKKDLAKFKEVLLYVLSKVAGKPNVGETVLHKLLYFIDFDYYEKFEESLMGATYIKNYHGPTSVELGSVIQAMQKNKEIEAVKSRYFKYEQKKYLPLKRPNLDLLTARELGHIDEVLARLSDKNGKEIEHYSHSDIPWMAAEDGKPLSYESVFYRDERHSVRNHDDDL